MPAASDAGPLIWLGKCGILLLLEKLYSEILIPEAVHEESVSSGLEMGFEDAQAIEKAMEEVWIKVCGTSERFTGEVEGAETRLDIELGRGEREAIALASERGISTFLTNDEDAHHVGMALGLEPKGVLYVLLRGVAEGLVDKKRAREYLGQMLDGGFWPSPAIIHDFHEALDKLPRGS